MLVWGSFRTLAVVQGSYLSCSTHETHPSIPWLHLTTQSPSLACCFPVALLNVLPVTEPKTLVVFWSMQRTQSCHSHSPEQYISPNSALLSLTISEQLYSLLIHRKPVTRKSSQFGTMPLFKSKCGFYIYLYCNSFPLFDSSST